MKPEFYRSIKPEYINQKWGVYNPAVYSQFGFSRHNGVDLRLSSDKKIYAAFSGVVYRRGYQPDGGGIFVSVISDEYDFPAFSCTTPDGEVFHFQAGKYRVLLDYLHLDTILVNEGDRIEAGSLVAIGDNTGKSTGEHCHEQWRRVTWDGSAVIDADSNDANNSFNPNRFYTMTYAVDLEKTKNLLILTLGLATQLLALLKKKYG